MRSHGFDGMHESPKKLMPLLEQGYVVVQLGLFDVWHPRYLLNDRRQSETFKYICTALLEMQGKWLEWVAESKTLISANREITTLKRWIRAWKNGELDRKNDLEEGKPDLLRILKSKDNIITASRRFADLMIQGRYFDQSTAGKTALVLVLSPTRKDFLGLGSFLGSLKSTSKRILWRDGLALWTSFVHEGVHVLALEHPACCPGSGDETRGIDMNAREETGLLQHVTQHAMDYLLAFYNPEFLPPDLAKGLSMNMVIALFNENNVRAGGGIKGRRTEAYTEFVAGGNSSGGRLAARNADIHWRHSKGRDYFTGELRAAQKKGARIAFKSVNRKRDKRLFFALEPDSGSGENHLVCAPFLDKGLETSEIPDAYSDEYLEFRRAYRSAFAYWLQHKAKGASNHDMPAKLIRSLLINISTPSSDGGEKSFEELVYRIYGIPLTRRKDKVDCLEWRFLDWLSRRR